MLKASLSWLVTGGLLFAFWLLLVDSPAEPQVIVGMFVAAAGATASELARRQRIANLRFTFRDLVALWRPAASVPGDIARLLRALPAGRRGMPIGRFRAIRFEPAANAASERPDAGGNARQALAELAGSISPNTYAVGVDVDRRILLVHQLLRDDAAADSIEPFARAKDGER